MSACPPAALATERGRGRRIAGRVLVALLVLAGLAGGALAGLLLADWLGWAPKLFVC